MPARMVSASKTAFLSAVKWTVQAFLLGMVLLFVETAPAQVSSWTYQTAADVPFQANSCSGTLNLTLGFAPTPGQRLMVVNNSGGSFLAGQFSNVTNGATVDLTYGGRTYSYVAWYYGGDGNDLELVWRQNGLAAWGNNQYGGLGIGSSDATRYFPTLVDASGGLAGKTVVQVCRSSNHSMVLCSDGTIFTWGDNRFGQLGDGTTVQRLVPGVVNAESGVSALFGKQVVAVSAAYSHNVALCSDGTVVAWGYNFNGRLGDGTLDNRLFPVAVNTDLGISALAGKSVRSIATGRDHNVALCTDGTVVAWGLNNYGQLGDRSTTARSLPVLVSTTNTALTGRTVVRVSTGGNHTFAICSDGTTAAWGDNSSGQLGVGSTSSSNRPVSVIQYGTGNALQGKVLKFVTGGSFHSVGLCTDGSVVAWGLNSNAQLGDGTTTQRSTPKLVTGLIGAAGPPNKVALQVAAGSIDGRALLSDGSIVTWGANGAGQFGNGLTGQSSVPQTSNTQARDRVLNGRFISRMGEGISGQHNVVVFGIDGPPVVTTGTASLVTATTAEITGSVASSGGQPVTERGIVWAMSPNPNVFYQTKVSDDLLGDGGFNVVLQGLPSNTLLYARAYAINGEISYGQEISFTTSSAPLADLNGSYNAATDVPLTTNAVNLTGGVLSLSLNFAPQPGTNLTVIRKLSRGFITGQFANAANGSTVELTYNGNTYPFVAWYYGGDGNDLVLLWPYTGVATWGRNSAGQLGDNSTLPRNAAVAVNNSGALLGKTVVQLAHGADHSLALCADGSLLAWGVNSSGQLGNNLNIIRPYPVPVDVTPGVSALAGKLVVAVAAGNTSSTALCSDGTVVTWGSGQSVPTAVNSDFGTSALFGKKVVSIASGYSHRLALCLDGTLVAWGTNTKGQLGDATTILASNPVSVSLVDGFSALAGKSVKALAAGLDHSMALSEDGSVAVWGGNAAGQLGDGQVTDRSVPTLTNQAVGLSALAGESVIAIAAGSEHCLALRSDGIVAAWGRNSYGQLGDNSTTHRNFPTAVNTVAGMSALSGKHVISLSSGSSHSIAFCNDGSVGCWGYNSDGALGDNSAAQRLVPTALNVATGVSALAGRVILNLSRGFGGYHSAAIYALNRPPSVTTDQPSLVGSGSAFLSGNVTSSGDAPVTERGVVWSSTPNPTTANFKTPSGNGTGTFSITLNHLPTSTTFYARAYAISTEGTSYGDVVTFTTLRADVGSLTWNYLTPTEVPLTAEGVDLTGGLLNLTLDFPPPVGTNLTVIRKTGLGFITGRFSNVPHGSTVNLSHNGLTYPFVAWYYGGDGNDLVLLWPYIGVAAWGKNSNGQLGDATLTQRLVPVDVNGAVDLYGKTVVKLAHGKNHSLALCTDGSVMAWGSNALGQLGNSTTIDRLTPVQVDQFSSGSALLGKTVVNIAAGSNHSLAVCSDGTMAAWGYNAYGQLGNDAPTSQSSTPVSVNLPPGRKVIAAGGGSSFTLALCSDGSLLGCGDNTSGQLGNGTTSSSRVPVDVSLKNFAGRPMKTVACGSHTLALDFEGKVWSWGTNNFGQLGDNTTTNRTAPSLVDPLGLSVLAGRTVISIHCGTSHSYALCSDGTVASWGGNSFGQLADNTTTSRRLPVLVNTTAGLSGLAGKVVESVAAAEEFGIALCSDGTVATWGINTYGQLGDNTTTTRLVPVAVNIDPGSSALAGRKVTGLSSGSAATHLLATYAIGAPPTVHTGSVDAVTLDSAALNGSVSTEVGSPVIERGFLWSCTPNLSMFSPKIVLGTGPGPFTTTLSGLFSNTTYYFRAYARNSEGLVYGNESSFTTPTELVNGLSWTYTTAADVPLNLDSATVTGELTLELNFRPKAGNILKVLENSGPDFIHGEFSNAPNGSTINLSFDGIDYPFIAWYYGGSGNDLVLLWPHTGLVAWGSNSSGQIGDNSTADRNLPVSVDQSGVLRGKTVVQISRGLTHVVALCSDHSLAAWGSNSHGQLGDNTTVSRRVPTQVDLTALGGRKVISVAVCPNYSLALCSDGSVASWGMNLGGDAGDANVVRLVPMLLNQSDPSSALFQQSIVAIAAGDFHCLALGANGVVFGWGANSNGELGNETRASSRIPVKVNTRDGVSGLSSRKAVDISAGNGFSLAVSQDEKVVAWGENGYGQLGDNSSMDQAVPVAVNSSSGISLLYGKSVKTISAGNVHSLALCTDGTPLAWGYNASGQLGDNSGINRATPVGINVVGTSALAGKQVTSLQGGYFSSLALCSDGAVASWGLSNQVGDGGSTSRSSPVLVSTTLGGGLLANRFVNSLGRGSSGSTNYVIYGLTSIEAWRQQYFGSHLNSQAASTADPDADGIPNLVEYGFGLDPLVSNPLSQLPNAQLVAGHLELEFTPPDGRSGVLYGAEWSDTLLPGSWTPISDSGTTSSHKFRLPVGPQPKKFLRLKVTEE